MKKWTLAFCCIITMQVIAQKNTDATKYAATITQQDLKKQLYIIASDAMQGRETATEGQRKAAAYIEDEFKRIGLKPGNNNSYQQIFNVYKDELATASLKLYNASFQFEKHFSIPSNNTAQGNWQINDIVFAGFGNDNKTTNDYKNLDVKGKWVIIIESNEDNIEKAYAAADRSNSFSKQELLCKKK